MRLNKKKLAAVMMSAVMAASVTPVTAFAEAEADMFAAEAADVQVEERAVEEAVTYEVVGAEFDMATGKLTLTLQGSDGSTTTEVRTDAKKSEVSPATCDKPATYQWKATAYFTEYKSEIFPEGEALGHDWKESEFIQTQAPTCTTPGKGYYVEKCTRCTATRNQTAEVETEKAAHSYGAAVVEYYDLVNIKTEVNDKGEVVVVLGENGKPQLENTKLPGQYTEESFQTCSACGIKTAVKDTKKTVELTAEDAKEHFSAVTEVKGVVDADVAELMGKTEEEAKKVNLNTLEMKDCTKDGSYIVSYYGGDGVTVIRKQEFPIPAHHVEEYQEPIFKTAADEKNCTVKYDAKTGRYTVINNTCNKVITYTQVVKCTAAGCKLKDKVIRKDSVEVQPTGAHVVATATRNTVKALMAADAKGYINADQYAALEEYAKKNPKLVKLASTAICDKEGKATITYICQVCGKDTTITDSVKVVALGHVKADPVQENKVEPTCTTLGSYDAVVYCSRCKAELSRTKDVKIPRVKHTNEKSVTPSGVGIDDTETDKTAYIQFDGTRVIDTDGRLQDHIKDNLEPNYGVGARAVTNCETCKKHIVTVADLEVKVLSVKKETKVGGVGSITLEASYRKKDGKTLTEQITLPYFSTHDAYMNYVDDIKITVDGLYKDADGVYRYYVNGEVAKDFVGIVEFEGGEFFVANGVVCTEANGMNEYAGKWYFLSQGQIQRGYNGLAEYDGAWFYLTNGELTTTINGLVSYNGGQFVFAEGRLVKEANGLWQDADGTWYFLSQGQVQTQYTGVAMYDGEFFVVKAGKLASDYNGTIEYDGAEFNVVAGQLYDQVA